MNRRIIGGMLSLLMLSGVVYAQRHWDQHAWDALDYAKKIPFPDNRFTFCRVRYTSFNEPTGQNSGGVGRRIILSRMRIFPCAWRS